MKVLLLSPYQSGSHQSWSNGYAKASGHDVQLLTMPGRFWKWRMHGAAVTLGQQFLELDEKPDLIVATDMLDLAAFAGLTRKHLNNVSLAVYMHENQLTYPLPADGSTGPMRRQLGERDRHYAFINITSMLAADHVFFNSEFHRQSLLTALPPFLKHYPDHNELDSVAVIANKSSVLPVGLPPFSTTSQQSVNSLATATDNDVAPLIIWNQRWEYDKNPEAFFAALGRLAADSIPFRLALCGERFSSVPTVFDQAVSQFSEQIIHVGHADRTTYEQLLFSADLTLSTAQHEFFGISVLEAIAASTFPLLPNRLSYPELLPQTAHHHCLYENEGDLDQKLRWALAHSTERKTIATQLSQTAREYLWPAIISRYDTAFDDLV